MKTSRPLFLRLVIAGILVAIAITGVLWLSRAKPKLMAQFLSSTRNVAPQLVAVPPFARPMTRPYGMAPVAWNAYLRACKQAKIHPRRIGQTVGDHPRSVGYHKRDGVLRISGQNVDYTTAIDLGTWDLTPAQISAFVDALAAQGFAAFYRHKGKWKGGEHIHAIYAFLPMKPQLQIQVKEFLRDKRREGKSPKWRAKLKSQETKLKHWMVW